MQILSKQIGRLPFALASILLYISVPLYYAAWEYETVEPYLSEPTGLVMGLFSILGSGIPFCFAHQVGGLASLEFTAPFALLLLLVTLWRCNDCRASRLVLVGQCLPLLNLLTLVYLTVQQRPVRPVHSAPVRQSLPQHAEASIDWCPSWRHIA
ncbi:hypothetical protein [Mitsuokella multacida]|uniref:hypothetical protein n=1 Tax=Mitsuokella multacida TaxID=52226 RepID=UPI0024300784|nr:hypothetical protein [Mitsuokella multacida]